MTIRNNHFAPKRLVITLYAASYLPTPKVFNKEYLLEYSLSNTFGVVFRNGNKIKLESLRVMNLGLDKPKFIATT